MDGLQEFKECIAHVPGRELHVLNISKEAWFELGPFLNERHQCYASMDSGADFIPRPHRLAVTRDEQNDEIERLAKPR
jgi:hypothetical protein